MSRPRQVSPADAMQATDWVTDSDSKMTDDVSWIEAWSSDPLVS